MGKDIYERPKAISLADHADPVTVYTSLVPSIKHTVIGIETNNASVMGFCRGHFQTN